MQKIKRGLRKVEHRVAPERQKKHEERLWNTVSAGVLAEALLKHPGWRELLEPWLTRKKEENANVVMNPPQRNYPEDEGVYYERGKAHLVSELKAYLKATITFKKKAEQELKTMKAPGRPSEEKQ